MNDEPENNLKISEWWTVSRPYRVMGELVLYSAICLGSLMLILSKVGDGQSYRFFDIQPIYWVGILAGGLGGCTRGLIDFWRRTSFNLMKRDYWKHALPFYIGTLFGFLMVLVIQTTFKVFSVEHSGADVGGLSFLAMVCMFSGLFTDKAESIFSKKFSEAANKNE